MADSADAMKAGGGAHDAAHVLLAEGGGGVRAAQGVEESDRESRDFRRAMWARIGGAGGGAETCHGGEREALALRQAVAPIVPEAGFAQGELAIGFDALVALAMDDFLPDVMCVGEFVLRGFVVRRVLGDDYFEKLGEDVEIVDVAEQIL